MPTPNQSVPRSGSTPGTTGTKGATKRWRARPLASRAWPRAPHNDPARLRADRVAEQADENAVPDSWNLGRGLGPPGGFGKRCEAERLRRRRLLEEAGQGLAEQRVAQRLEGVSRAFARPRPARYRDSAARAQTPAGPRPRRGPRRRESRSPSSRARRASRRSAPACREDRHLLRDPGLLLDRAGPSGSTCPRANVPLSNGSRDDVLPGAGGRPCGGASRPSAGSRRSTAHSSRPRADDRARSSDSTRARGPDGARSGRRSRGRGRRGRPRRWIAHGASIAGIARILAFNPGNPIRTICFVARAFALLVACPSWRCGSAYWAPAASDPSSAGCWPSRACGSRSSGDRTTSRRSARMGS